MDQKELLRLIGRLDGNDYSRKAIYQFNRRYFHCHVFGDKLNDKNIENYKQIKKINESKDKCKLNIKSIQF